MFKRLKISQKFALFFIIITIGPLLTVAFLSYSHTLHQLEQRILVGKMSTEEVFAPLNQLHNAMLLIMAVVILLILIALEIMDRTFIRPIVDLRNAAAEVGQGDLNKKLKADSEDELGDLTREFNDMVRHLRRDKEQLEEQKRDLQEANKELDNFVYIISHDLRAPLRGIAFFARVLQEDYGKQIDKKGQEHLREIHEGTGRLNRLIDDLLDLTQLSRIKNPYSSTDMKEVIKTSIDQLKHEIREKDAEVVLSGDLPTVVCDPVKMRTVFQNLIHNALKFSREDKKERLRVEIGYASTPDAHQFFVKDNGIGIDPEYHEAVFTLFRKLHTNKEFEGTGAGLSIIQRIVEEHGGRIWVESKEGEGATFYFTVPKGIKEA